MSWFHPKLPIRETAPLRRQIKTKVAQILIFNTFACFLLTTLTYRNSNLPRLTSDSITIFQISKITRNNCYSWLLDGNSLLSVSDSLKSTQLWEVSGSFFPCRFFLASAFSLIWFTQKGSDFRFLYRSESMPALLAAKRASLYASGQRRGGNCLCTRP